MTDIKIDTSGPKETGINLHHLPVQIQHTGMAKVSSFFRIEPSEMKYEGMLLYSMKIYMPKIHYAGIPAGKPVMEAAFRGRKLRGVNVAVPEQYNGTIFQPKILSKASKTILLSISMSLLRLESHSCFFRRFLSLQA